MAILSTSRPGEYMTSGGWKVWEGQLFMACEGWKFHIAAAKEDAEKVLKKVTKHVLYPMEVAHKHWPTDDPVGNKDDNGGKWFAIYPNSILNAFILVAAIDDVLQKASIEVPEDGTIPYELKVGKGYVLPATVPSATKR